MPLRCYLRSASPCFYMRKGPVPCLASNRTLHYRKTGMVTDPCSAPLCDVCDLVDHVCDLDKSIMCVILTDRAMCGSTGRGAVEGHQCTPGVRVIACMRPHTHIHTHTHTHTLQAIETRQLHHSACETTRQLHHAACSTTIVERVFAAGSRCHHEEALYLPTVGPSA